jgi:hypothetical protein
MMSLTIIKLLNVVFEYDKNEVDRGIVAIDRFYYNGIFADIIYFRVFSLNITMLTIITLCSNASKVLVKVLVIGFLWQRSARYLILFYNLLIYTLLLVLSRAKFK